MKHFRPIAQIRSAVGNIEHCRYDGSKINEPDQTEHESQEVASLIWLICTDTNRGDNLEKQGKARIAPGVVCGEGRLLLIAGPCVIESAELCLEIAQEVQAVAAELQLPAIFKGSFDKANRTSVSSYRGVGLEAGLKILRQIHEQTGLPVTTDIHEPQQAAPVAEVCELLQIPAFLARQTDLLQAAAATGRAVNVKKGQFMAPQDMRHVVGKLNESDCRDVMLTERGTFFGYGNLVNDMRSLVTMRQWAPVVFDATHSVQQPSGSDGKTGGNRDMVPYLARAAAAVGMDGLFVETHPNPDSSPSDAANILPLDQLKPLIQEVVRIRDVLRDDSTPL